MGLGWEMCGDEKCQCSASSEEHVGSRIFSKCELILDQHSYSEKFDKYGPISEQLLLNDFF